MIFLFYQFYGFPNRIDVKKNLLFRKVLKTRSYILTENSIFTSSETFIT